MTVADVTIPTIKAFCNLEPKAQALKPLEDRERGRYGD